MTALRYDLALLVAALAWGINVPLSKVALREIDPLVYNALRFPLSVVFIGWMARRELLAGATERGARLRGWWVAGGLGLIGHFAYQLLFLVGLDRTSSGNTALLISTAPLWTALLALATGVELLRGRTWFGLVAAFVGAAVLALQGDGAGAGGVTVTGNLMVVASAVCWAIYGVGTKPQLARTPALLLAFRAMAVATVPLVLVALPRAGATAWSTLSPLVWGAVVFSGVFSSGLAYALWSLGVRQVGPSHTAVYTNLVPVITLLIAYGWLAEVPTPVQLAGGALVVGGLFTMRRSR